jgi:septum formation protein
MPRRLVLASASPRRRELLGAVGLEFTVAPADLDEDAIAGGRAPADGALAVARAKAAAVPHADAVVLAADTVVVIDGRTLGKPPDAAAARAMLATLRARTHEVITAVVVAGPDGLRDAARTSAVRMRAWDVAEAEAYVASGGGLDKAGGYGIQDHGFSPVETIDGCWCNVMGLPLWTAWALLATAGCPAPRDPASAFPRCATCPLRSDATA